LKCFCVKPPVSGTTYRGISSLSLSTRFLGLPNPVPDAHQNDLRRFINRICQEVVNISNSLDYTGVTNAQDDKLFAADPRTYEQLVATAVLNKVGRLLSAGSDGWKTVIDCNNFRPY
jgi:hypothetical protein